MLYIRAFIISIIIVFSLSAQSQTDIKWPSLADSPWPMIGHDPQLTGRSPYVGPQNPEIVWSKSMQGGIFSGPVIGEKGNLYFGSYGLLGGDDFFSYSSDGVLNWFYDTESNKPPTSGVVVDSSNIIYFTSFDHALYALNPDGSLKWKLEGENLVELAIPNIDKQGNLYITNWEGELLSVNPNGEVVLRVKYGDERGFIGMPPAFSPDGETIYIGGNTEDLYALNLDGTLKWKFECGRMDNPPVVDADGRIYFFPLQSPSYIYSLNPDGTIYWRYYVREASFARLSSKGTIDHEGNFYIVAYDTTRVYNFTLSSFTNSGELRWHYYFPEGEEFTQPLVCDAEGTVYVGSTFGFQFYAINNDGTLKWKMPLDDWQVDNTVAIDKDGTLYLGLHKSSIINNNGPNLIAIRDTSATKVEVAGEPVKEFSLSQNYPNPFNPATVIKYQLPEAGHVTLKVYDVIGREVSKLVNTYQSAGKYEVKFDASLLSSGLYIYRIQAGKYSASNKMMLLR